MSVDIWDVLKAVTPVVISIVGWGVKQVYNEIRAQRQELREYVRRRESDIAQL